MGDIAKEIEKASNNILNIHNDSLLFRIYDKQNNILMYPEFSELGCTFGESPDGVHYPKDASDFLFDICAWDSTRYTAEKCTGLRDGTNRLIYENDEFVHNLQQYRVIYIEKEASFYFYNTGTDKILGITDININDIVICGNIHEI